MSEDNVEWFGAMCSKIRGQMASTKMWMSKFEQYKDAPARRNAALALGKLSGMYQVLAEIADKHQLEMPEDIFLANAQGEEDWEKLSE